MNSIIITGYLLLGTWQDIKKRKISRNYLLFGGILGAVIRIISYRKENLIFAEWLVAFFPGIIILVIAKLTKEKMGVGDGYILMVLANYMNLWEICMLLQTAIIFTSLFALLLICNRKVSKEYPIPFLPFLWIAHMVLWRIGYV